jgi:hypothetical protein
MDFLERPEPRASLLHLLPSTGESKLLDMCGIWMGFVDLAGILKLGLISPERTGWRMQLLVLGRRSPS